jgi:hypothetical protein
MQKKRAFNLPTGGTSIFLWLGQRIGCKNGLITKYRLVKNLPEEFFDNEHEIDIKKVYPDLVFEWEEVSQHNKNAS